MKLHVIALALLFTLVSTGANGKKTELYNSRYFSFQSSQQLNTHLFLYSKALGCRFAKVHNDSLARHAFKDKWQSFSEKDKTTVNAALRFYKDSLLGKDLLFDSLMRSFEDYLSSDNTSRSKLKTNWQLAAADVLRNFQPCFIKFYWPAIDSANKAWLAAYKSQIANMEQDIVPELERIYKTSLSDERIRVDLTCYGTWAGAFSYNDGFCHIVFSTQSKSNQGNLAAEVMFHETSHFLVDKLEAQIKTASRKKNVTKDLALWHNMIFYTTGYVMEKHYRLKWEKFEPYYVQMQFQEKFPEFKNSVDACKLYWDAYLKGESSFDEAVNKVVAYVIEKQQ